MTGYWFLSGILALVASAIYRRVFDRAKDQSTGSAAAEVVPISVIFGGSYGLAMLIATTIKAMIRWG
jgi:hypothetical protein